MGPVWSSAMGGGDGSRGEDEGETELAAAMAGGQEIKYVAGDLRLSDV